MMPSPAAYLQGLARLLGEQVSPRLPTPFEQAGMQREPMHLQAVAIEFERAAARRVQENQAIRHLMARAAALPELAPALKARCERLAAGADTDLSIGALQDGNQALRAGLIALQAELEGKVDHAGKVDQAGEVDEAPHVAPSAALLEAIWQELRTSTERRRLPSDRF